MNDVATDEVLARLKQIKREEHEREQALLARVKECEQRLFDRNDALALTDDRLAAATARAERAEADLQRVERFANMKLGMVVDKRQRQTLETFAALARGGIPDWIKDAESAALSTAPTPAPEAGMVLVPRALDDIAAERRRQMEVEGWTPEHDDTHDKGEMALAAACYAHASGKSAYSLYHVWPWDLDWFKLGGKRRNLVKAGALIVAEIERLDRASQQEGT